MMYYDYVKRLGQWHLAKVNVNPEKKTVGTSGETLCGRPMLGTNHIDIPEADRDKCEECFAIQQNEFDEKFSLKNIIDGKTGYDHGDSLKSLYEHLSSCGNSADWQLFILSTLFRAIDIDQDAKLAAMNDFISKVSSN